MANRLDDMVITPRGPKKESEKRVRTKAREKRRARSTKKRRSKFLKKLRGAMAAKSGFSATRRRMRKVRRGVKMRGKGIGKAGWFSLITTAIDIGAEGVARISHGMSQRLYHEHQRQSFAGYGQNLLSEAHARVRGEFEADPDILRGIALDDAVSSQLLEMSKVMSDLEYDRLAKVANVAINPELDSYDGMKEIVIRAMLDDGRREKLIQLAKETALLAKEWTGFHHAEARK